MQPDAILYIENLEVCGGIVTRMDNPLLLKKTIVFLEVKLLTNQFVQIHRSCIVAVSAIISYTPRHVEIAGLELPIGRLYQKNVERILAVSNRRLCTLKRYFVGFHQPPFVNLGNIITVLPESTNGY